MTELRNEVPCSLPELFRNSVEAHPDKIAVVGNTDTLTFDGLAAGVTSLHSAFREGGFERAVFAVLLASDIPYVATVVAVTMARGVFAPLEETWPDSRLVAALEVARPAVLVVAPSQLERAERLVADAGLRCALATVSFEAERKTIRWTVVSQPSTKAEAHNSRESDWRGDSLYLVYTSGSTGVPNAVEGAHLSLAHFIQWQARTFGVDSACRVAQLAPTTFDVSLRDIFLPLATGGSLLIPTAATKYHPILLPQWLAKNSVNLMHSVPSLFKFVSQTARTQRKLEGAFQSIRRLFLSGERLYTEDARTLYESLSPEARIFNFYGPSEGTLIKTFFEVPREPGRLARDVVPLGRAIDGCRVHLDPPASNADEPGEIVLESRYLAKGYFGNPTLTALKFSDGDEGVRRYKTGDLGFTDASGCLHFVGRKDHQVKLNGNRVELGDIEHCVRRAPGVDGAVVVASEPSRDAPLSVNCAYVSASGVSEDAVRAHLRSHLPAYMVPTGIAKLAELPLLPNGKADRKHVARMFAERSSQ
jgi:amino acid adenylation domain-containing protein